MVKRPWNLLSGVGIAGQIFFIRNLEKEQTLKIYFTTCVFCYCHLKFLKDIFWDQTVSNLFVWARLTDLWWDRSIARHRTMKMKEMMSVREMMSGSNSRGGTEWSMCVRSLNTVKKKKPMASFSPFHELPVLLGYIIHFCYAFWCE